jgi:hypothetical protein
MARYRLIDTAGSELGFAELDPEDVAGTLVLDID